MLRTGWIQETRSHVGVTHGENKNRNLDFYKMTWYCKILKVTYPLSKLPNYYEYKPHLFKKYEATNITSLSHHFWVWTLQLLLLSKRWYRTCAANVHLYSLIYSLDIRNQSRGCLRNDDHIIYINHNIVEIDSEKQNLPSLQPTTTHTCQLDF